MSSIIPIECKCFICGETHEYGEIMSTNTFEGPDLDLRPSEMQRSTMGVWLQECPGCGYVSSKVSDSCRVTKEWLQSEKYLTCDGITFEWGLAKRFYKRYLISLEENKTENAFFALVHAAWACDDKMDILNAKHCRELAIDLSAKLSDSDNGSEKSEKIKIIRADLMRRAEKFDELIEEYSSYRSNDENYGSIIKFQLEKAKEKDPDCYCIRDVQRFISGASDENKVIKQIIDDYKNAGIIELNREKLIHDLEKQSKRIGESAPGGKVRNVISDCCIIQDHEFINKVKSVLFQFFEKKSIEYFVKDSSPGHDIIDVKFVDEEIVFFVRIHFSNYPKDYDIDVFLPIEPNEQYELLLCEKIVKENLNKRFGALQYDKRAGMIIYRTQMILDYAVFEDKIISFFLDTLKMAVASCNALIKESYGKYSEEEKGEIIRKLNALQNELKR